MAMQVIAMRLNVKLSPDLERQLIDASMVPLTEEHILTIQTTSAMSAPLPQPTRNLPSILGPASSAMRAASSASQSGKLVIPTWATLNRADSIVHIEGSLLSHKPGAAGPYGYQPDYMHVRSPTGRLSELPIKRNNSAALLSSPTSPDGQAPQTGSPVSRQASKSSLALSGGLVKQGSVGKLSGLVKQGSLLGPGLPPRSGEGGPVPTAPLLKQGSLPSGRGRRPSLLALAGLHSLPEHDPYLGPAKAGASPRRTSSFLTGNLSTPLPSSYGSRKGSFEDSTAHSATMPMISLEAQMDVLDASLTEPELVDQRRPEELARSDASHLMVEVSRSSTSGSLEAHAAAAALPPVLVSLLCPLATTCRLSETAPVMCSV